MRTIILFGWVTFWLSLTGIGQGPRSANRNFERGQWDKSISIYTKYLAHHEDTSIRFQLGKLYHLSGKPWEAATTLQSLVNLPNPSPYWVKLYADVLRETGNYFQAKHYYQTLLNWKGAKDLPQLISACDFALEALRDSSQWEIKPMRELNTPMDEMGPIPYRLGVAYAANHSRGYFLRAEEKGKGKPFFDLYYSPRTGGGHFGKPEYLPGRLNGPLQDGPATFSQAGHRAFVTRSFFGPNKKAPGTGEIHLGIAESQMVEGKWKRPKFVPFCSPAYNSGFPTLAFDEKTLVFSSDRPGGLGGWDLYEVCWDGKAWSTPKNLGPSVNSAYNELFPSFGGDSILFFSSNRPAGLGGLDIYQVRKLDGIWIENQNLGYPLNSPRDDFGMNWVPGNPFGYLSSNRPGGEGGDDLYRFRRFPGLDVFVVDDDGQIPLGQVEVRIEDLALNDFQYETDHFGYVRHTFRNGNSVKMSIHAHGYKPFETLLNLDPLSPNEDGIFWARLQRDRQYLLALKMTDTSGRAISGGKVRLISQKEQGVKEGAPGQFQQKLDPNEEYTVLVEAPGFKSQVFHFETEAIGVADTEIVLVKMVPGMTTWLEGQALYGETGSPLPHAHTVAFNSATQEEVWEGYSRRDGRFWVPLESGEKWSILAGTPGYLTVRREISCQNGLQADTFQRKFPLFPMAEGTVIKVVYFDYKNESTNIIGRQDLMEIVHLLKDNPDIFVELNAYTDSRGSARYNKKLSEARANSAVNFIVKKGISQNRIIPKGLGEKFLVNECRDGVTCKEAQHALNRRAELRIFRVVSPFSPESKPDSPKE